MDSFDLKNWRFYAGYGEARYDMKRGSFKIRDNVTHKTQLTLAPEGDGPLLARGAPGVEIAMTRVDAAGVDTLVFRQTEGRPINRFWIEMPAAVDEHIYGCGETFTEFDLKGLKARIWVAEHQNMSRFIGKIIRNTFGAVNPDRKMRFEKYETYYAQPTFTSSGKYFVHLDSETYMEFEFRPETHVLYCHALPERLCVGKAKSFEELSGKLNGLLGFQPLAPSWINDGLIIAVQGDTQVLKNKVKTALDAGIPLAGVWTQDWCGARFTQFGRQVMWNWQWDENLYPGLPELIKEWKALGIRFLGYINPFIAIEGELYKYASEHGYCVKDRKGGDYMATTTTFPAAMVDLTNPEAYRWYKKIIRENMIGFGLDGWMADFGEYMPVDAALHDSGDNVKTHNGWPARWARLNREALEEARAQDELFFFTRAGHTGTVRDSMMMWNGDQHVDWSLDDGLPTVVPAALSLAMSGYGIAHSDIGGYTTMPGCSRGAELLMRWAELAAFSPLMRCHEGNRPKDNAQFDHSGETLAHFARMTRVHVTLKVYINALIRQNHEAGAPVMRPLFYHYDQEELFTEPCAYLLGREMACYPVVRQNQRRRRLLLPDDAWIHLFTGVEYSGGIHEVECPMGGPPVFYRKNGGYTELFGRVRDIL